MIEDLIRRCPWALKLKRAEAILAGARSRAGVAAAYGLALAVLAAVFGGSSVVRQEFDLPVSVVSRLPRGRVFTTDRWADYLIYRNPQRRVFFDTRNDLYGEDFVRNYFTVMKAQPGWHHILERYGVVAAMVPPGSSISAGLASAPGWALNYQDDAAAVYVRTEASTANRQPELRACS
jgi:hypothetical protein